MKNIEKKTFREALCLVFKWILILLCSIEFLILVKTFFDSPAYFEKLFLYNGLVIVLFYNIYDILRRSKINTNTMPVECSNTFPHEDKNRKKEMIFHILFQVHKWITIVICIATLVSGAIFFVFEKSDFFYVFYLKGLLVIFLLCISHFLFFRDKKWW